MAQPYANTVGLIVAWNVMDFLLPPVHTIALNLLYPGTGTTDSDCRSILGNA